MADYRVEIEAVQIIHVNADSAEEAKEKVKFVWLTLANYRTKEYLSGVSANYHYEKCDFDKAKVTNEDE